jgi:hypothetical protein
MSHVICEVNWDDCERASVNVDGEQDIVYFDAKKGDDGWYLTIVLDCNTAGYCDTITQDDGPYGSRDTALLGGLNFVFEWMSDNHPEMDIECSDYIHVLMDGKND